MALSVGFIGVGNMGNPMAGNILKAGFPMAVFDLNPKAMANLVEAGARRAESALAALEGADVVLTSLPASPDVEAMYLDAGGLVERAKPGTILIDLSSVLPSTPRKIEPRAKARGVHFLEAPVSGGVTGARAGTLAIMVGGDKAALSRAEPVLKAMGPNVFHVGPAGAGNTEQFGRIQMRRDQLLRFLHGCLIPTLAHQEFLGNQDADGRCGYTAIGDAGPRDAAPLVNI